MSTPGRPKANTAVRSTEVPDEHAGPSQGEYRSAQHGGFPMSTPGRPKANTAVRSTEVS